MLIICAVVFIVVFVSGIDALLKVLTRIALAQEKIADSLEKIENLSMKVKLSIPNIE